MKKSQNKFNWKKVFVAVSVSLNVLLILLSAATYYWVNKIDNPDYAYAVYQDAYDFSCVKYGDEFGEAIREENKNKPEEDTIGASVVFAMTCGRDYETGKDVDISQESVDSIYKDVLKVRNSN